MKNDPKTPMYKYLSMREMHDKGSSFKEIGDVMGMTAAQAEKILRQGANINRKHKDHVGLVHKLGKDYLYLLPGDVWLGAKNREIVRVTGVNPNDIEVVVPHMTTETLLRKWGVSHSDLMKAERQYIERAIKGLPIKEVGSLDDKERLSRISTRRDTLLRRKNMKEGLAQVLAGDSVDQVVSRLVSE